MVRRNGSPRGYDYTAHLTVLWPLLRLRKAIDRGHGPTREAPDSRGCGRGSTYEVIAYSNSGSRTGAFLHLHNLNEQ